MEKKLVTDYLKAKGIFTYPDFTIEELQTAGDLVMFRECDTSGYYSEQHMIPLFEIVAWVYSQGKTNGALTGA